MNRSLTIFICYFMRDTKRCRFPAIEALSVERFCRQFDYIRTHYTPIETIASFLGNSIGNGKSIGDGLSGLLSTTVSQQSR